MGGRRRLSCPRNGVAGARAELTHPRNWMAALGKSSARGEKRQNAAAVRSVDTRGRQNSEELQLFERLEAGEHFLRFGEGFERDAIAEGEEFIPEREDVWIVMRGVDGFAGVPFRDFDDGAVACAHERGRALGDETFLA